MANNRDPSVSSVKDFSSDSEDIRFILVGQKLANSQPLQNALKTFSSPVVYSNTGFEFMKDADEDTVFVVENFEGSIFQQLYKEGCRIVAPPVVIKSAKMKKGIPYRPRPLYCTSMDKLILCFSGFKAKEDLTMMADLVHYMGGGIRKDFSAKVTHLVAMRSGGEKYRAAVSLGKHIMSEEWVQRCWESRDEIDVSAMDKHLMQLKLNPFSFSILSFLGFVKEEMQHMEEVAVVNGGTIAEAGSPTCTHLVVNEREVKNLPFNLHGKVHVVKSEWFWASIQMEACAVESMYAFEASDETPSAVENIKMTPNLPLSGSKSYKRKRVKENIAQLAYEGEGDVVFKRKSLDPACRSLNGSFLDTTADNATILCDVTIRESENHSPQQPTGHARKEPVKLNSRQQTIVELFQTESNYVGILHTILKVFKEEIERADQPGGPILDPQDSKAIFGGIPPIHDLHTKIRNELSEIIKTWTDGVTVGDVFLRHAEDLAKYYPNFVNYFEKTKEIVTRCDKTKPRFHAFLRVCQSKPECGRQTLTELLIRPVQRLPSVLLLLKDILKRTEISQPDHDRLNRAISALEEVMTHINEDKRKADGHQAMFEIMNNIENCPAKNPINSEESLRFQKRFLPKVVDPLDGLTLLQFPLVSPNLLSAHRSFARKIDTVEVTDEVLGKGDPVTLFIFSDSIEVCKRRTKAVNTKSPGTVTSKNTQKSYKHLDLWPFSSIKRVVDICETENCQNVFALITKKMEEKEEKLYAFAVVEQSVSKTDFLIMLSKAICSNMCRTNYEMILAEVEAQVLNIDATDLYNSKTLSRAATKFSKRVSRAFSLTKSPRGNMKRTIQSMSLVGTSPMRRENSLMTLPPLPSSSHLTSSVSSWMGSEVDMSETDSYSERVDQMSIGTLYGQKRRDTLAGLTVSDIQEDLKALEASQQSVDCLSGMLTTPRSDRRRPNPGLASPNFRHCGSRPEFASTQSLAIHTRYETGSPMPRTPSSLSCSSQVNEHYI